MEHPIQITFRGVDSSDALRQAVEQRAQGLERFYDKIESCHVALEAPHRRRRHGNAYRVRVRLTVPGEEIVVSQEPPEHVQHEDPYLAVNDAFKEAARRLEDYVRRRRGRVKEPIGPSRGRVVRLLAGEGYGFLETADGREVYFHENSVLDRAFHKLRPGTEVRFAEERGEKGAQASTVSIVGRGGGREA